MCGITFLLVASIPDQPVSDPVYDLNEGDEAAADAESHEPAHLLIIPFTFNNQICP